MHPISPAGLIGGLEFLLLSMLPFLKQPACFIDLTALFASKLNFSLVFPAVAESNSLTDDDSGSSFADTFLFRKAPQFAFADVAFLFLNQNE
jgi:hypothetical protein